MTELKEINFGFNKYCGPAVLSALTGESTDRCAAVISAITGQKEIKAVDILYIMSAFGKLGFQYEALSLFSGGTLYKTLTNLVNIDGFYIISVPHHVVAIEVKDKNIYFVDNHTKTPISASSSARLMQKVLGVWRITKKVTPKFVKSEIKVVCNSARHVTLFRDSIFENAEDNTSTRLGSFSFLDYEELKQIIHEMKRLIK